MNLLEERLENFSEKNSLEILEKISKGFSSMIYKAKNSKGKIVAVKIEHDKSPRDNMCLKEYEILKKANSLGIGPKVIAIDEDNHAIVMEYIDGITFNNWLLDESPSKKELSLLVDNLLEQAKRLDGGGISHGQLAGKGKNILVRNNKPIIIDFEKASLNRKCNNYNQLQGFLFKNPHSIIAKTVNRILEK